VNLSPGVPGAAVCTIHDGKLDMWFVGTRCHTAGPVDEETVWEGASLSKPVVADLALALAATGELDLDEPLPIDRDVLGEPPDPRWRDVTARRVLTHTTGLPNWRGPLEALRAGGWHVEDDAEQLTFERDPGTFGYSGEGFELLLLALCRRRGVRAADLLEPHLAHLGLGHSSFVWQHSFAECAAIPHQADGSALEKQRPGVARAAGSLHTTLPDYAAFARRVLEHGGDDIFEPTVVLDETQGRSLGWGSIATPDGVVAWQHGDNLGFKHLVALRRDTADGLVILTNGDNGHRDCSSLCRRLLDAAPW
jgi:CubicO group peptidase (beta-lactamase class C family)